MKEMSAVLVLIVVMSLCSLAQAFDGRPPHGMLSQLSADKELLFHQTMREVREGTVNIQEQIQGLESEIRDVLFAAEFNETLFLQKARALQELHQIVREKMDEAIAKLASQFTAEVRFGSSTTSGVVTYETVLKANNSDLSLRPGMTATAEITVKKVEEALLIPSAALRFTPPLQEEKRLPAVWSAGSFPARPNPDLNSSKTQPRISRSSRSMY